MGEGPQPTELGWYELGQCVPRSHHDWPTVSAPARNKYKAGY